MPPEENNDTRTDAELEAIVDAELNNTPAPEKPAEGAKGGDAKEGDDNAAADASDQEDGAADAGAVGDEGAGDDDKTDAGEAEDDDAAADTPAPKPAAKPAGKPAGEKSADDGKLTVEVEDADGKKYQIASLDDLPEGFTIKGGDVGALKLLDDLRGLREKQKEQDAEKAQTDQQAAIEQRQQEYQAAWDREIDSLMADGRLDKPTAKPGDKDFLKDPAVAKIDTVFKFMGEVNTARAKAGNPNRITSFEDALDKYELAESRKAAEAAKKAENDDAKQRGSVVGGPGAGSSKGPEPYTAGSHASIWDVEV